MKFPVPWVLSATALAVTVGPVIPRRPANKTVPCLDTVTWTSLELPLYGVTTVAAAPETLSATWVCAAVVALLGLFGRYAAAASAAASAAFCSCACVSYQDPTSMDKIGR